MCVCVCVCVYMVQMMLVKNNDARQRIKYSFKTVFKNKCIFLNKCF